MDLRSLLPLWPFGKSPRNICVFRCLDLNCRLRSSVVSVLFSLTTKMTAPRSSLVSQFLPPCLRPLLARRGHDDRAIALPACVVRGSLSVSLLSRVFLHDFMVTTDQQIRESGNWLILHNYIFLLNIIYTRVRLVFCMCL